MAGFLSPAYLGDHSSVQTCPSTCYVWRYARSGVDTGFIMRRAGGGAAGGAKLLHYPLSNQVLSHLWMTSFFLVGGSKDKKYRNA